MTPGDGSHIQSAISPQTVEKRKGYGGGFPSVLFMCYSINLG